MSSRFGDRGVGPLSAHGGLVWTADTELRITAAIGLAGPIDGAVGRVITEVLGMTESPELAAVQSQGLAGVPASTSLVRDGAQCVVRCVPLTASRDEVGGILGVIVPLSPPSSSGGRRFSAEIASVLHDVNNLLSVALGSAEVATGRADPELRAQDIEAIKGSVSRAGELLIKLRLGDDPADGGEDTVDLNEIVAGLELLLDRLTGGRIRLLTRFDPEEVRARIASTTVERILLNLVSNGAEAMPDGGVIRIETSAAGMGGRPDELTKCDYVSISVSDTGAGIDPADRDLIFLSAYSTKCGPGRGVGLNTVRSIVHAHGGVVGLASEPGEGSRFTIWLPAARRPTWTPPGGHCGG